MTTKTTKRQKSEKTISVQNLTSANKEVKTLMGTVKLIKTFWKAGYDKAFQFVGIDYTMLSFEKLGEIKALFPTELLTVDTDGKSRLLAYKKVARKNEAGNYIQIEKNHKLCRVYDKVVFEPATWSPNRLFNCLLEGKISRENLNATEIVAATEVKTEKTASKAA